jgi:hypothetical protein
LEAVDRIHLAQCRVQLWALVNTAVKLLDLLKAVNILTGCQFIKKGFILWRVTDVNIRKSELSSL